MDGDCNPRSNSFTTSLWKNIKQIILLFAPHTCFVVGNGYNVRFWKDIWWVNQALSVSFPYLFHISSQKEAFVAYVLSHSQSRVSWNLEFSRNLCEWEFDLVAQLLTPLKEVFITMIKRFSL